MSKTKWSKKPDARHRRKNALDRLEAQLKSGIKNTKDGEQPLTDKDRSRINGEIEILKPRV